MTEVDDLFGHAPLSDRANDAFQGYSRQALAAGRYDFWMGRKLRGYAEQAGLVVESFTIPDAELSFEGPASREVILAWRNRLESMKLLRDFCGGGFAEVRDEFLAAISLPNHRSVAKVCCVVAKTPDAA